ncbi:MAG: FHA domain-containing protein [Pirellulales bacterium]
MRVNLRITSSSKAGKELPLKRGTYLIGRSHECSLRARSDLVSRRHCELIVDRRSVVVRDLGSKNGTLVNGQRIDEPRALESGDKLQIGPMKFEVVIEAAADTIPAATIPADVVPAAAISADVVPADAVPADVASDVDQVGEHQQAVAESPASNNADAATTESAPVPTADVPAVQGDANGDYDADISDWLDDDQPNDEPVADQPVADAQATADTDVPAVDETQAVDRPAPHATPTGSDESHPKKSKAAESHTDKTKPGKLPSVSKEPSPDSGQAAADVLRNFSRRK